MSNVAICIANGKPVRLIGKNYIITVLNNRMTGPISRFKIGTDAETDFNTYLYIDRDDFFSKDKKKAKDGYCKSNVFKDYINKLNSVDIDSLLKPENWFDNEFNFAQIDDVFEITKVEFNSPFTQYYKRFKYSFKIKNLEIDFRNSSLYPQDIVSDIEDPNYNVKEDLSNDLLNNPTGKFFTENFDSKIATINEEYKPLFAEAMTMICFRIYWIKKEILGIVAKAGIDDIILAANNGTINTLLPVDQSIGELLKSWGYTNFPPTDLLTETSLEAYNRYYNSLLNFYSFLYLKKEDVLFKYDSFQNPLDEDGDPLTTDPSLRDQMDSERRIKYILKLLPSTALATFPVNERIKWIEDFISLDEIEETDERLVVKLIYSFVNPQDSDIFLDFLLKSMNADKINFENLYTKMDDDRAERYPFVSWFVDQQTNRKYFIYALYEMWKISKYNLTYVPVGVVPNDNGLNPNGYFISVDGLKHFKTYDSNGVETGEVEPILEFNVESLGGSIYSTRTKEVSYEPDIELNANKKIVINKKVRITTTNAFDTHGDGMYTNTSSSVHSNYHIYQPIALIGYEADLELTIPPFTTIPAFLFYYAHDFDKLKDFDAAISFGIEVAVEIGLFFALGGLGTLRHLKYLKYINRVGSAYRNSLAATDAVVVWRGLQAGTEALSVPAGILYSTTQFIANTTNDQNTYNLAKKLGTFFLVLTFASAGTAIYSRYRAVKSADTVLKEIDDLSDLGIPHGLAPEVLDVLYTIRNTANVTKTLFRNHITSLTVSELGEANHMADIFDNVLTVAEKDNFWRQFANKIENTTENIEFWKRMNKTENAVSAARMNIWKDAPAKFRYARRELRFLDEVVKLQIKDRKAYEHLSEFAIRPKSGTPSGTFNVTGGHKFNLILNGSNAHKIIDNGLEILDPNFVHNIINSTTSQKMLDYLNSVGNKIYSKTPKPNGHFQHKNILIKKVPQPTSINLTKEFVLNNKVYELKSIHTQLNPSWSETDIIHEFAYSLFNRKLQRVTDMKPLGFHGRSDIWIETTYRGYFMDGLSVKIKHVNYHRYNLQTTFNDHYSYFQINF